MAPRAYRFFAHWPPIFVTRHFLPRKSARQKIPGLLERRFSGTPPAAVFETMKMLMPWTSHTLIVAILIVCGSACRSLAAEPDSAPKTWNEVREAGRAKSRFLKEAGKRAESTLAIPTANLAH